MSLDSGGFLSILMPSFSMTVVMVSTLVVAKCTLLLLGAPDLLAGTAECLVCVKWLGNKVPTNDDAIELYLALWEHQFS